MQYEKYVKTQLMNTREFCFYNTQLDMSSCHLQLSQFLR